MTKTENSNPSELSAQLREIHGNMQGAVIILINQMVEVDRIIAELQKGGASND